MAAKKAQFTSPAQRKARKKEHLARLKKKGWKPPKESADAGTD